MPGEPHKFAASGGCDVTLMARGLGVFELLTWFPSVLFSDGMFIDQDPAFDYFYDQLFTPLLREIIDVDLEQALAAVITPDAVIRQSPKAPAPKPKPAAFEASPVGRAPAGRVAHG
jgi:hypothetical protein